jgi:hypothetical protein
MFATKKEANQNFNKYKEFTNIYHSIYWFKNKEEKFDTNGNFTRLGPDYNTAIITKINLDLDSYKTTRFDEKIAEIYTDEGLLSLNKFADWCEKNDYMREYVFSGGGFYGIVSAEGHPLKLRDGMLVLGQEANIEIDPATVGDTSRMRRVINSYNFKEHRKCYCIPLKAEELSLDYHQIRELAQKPRFRQRFVYGTNSYNLERFKIDSYKLIKKDLFIEIEKNPVAEIILGKYGWDTDDFCETIMHIISKDYLGHYLRFELIKYLKSIVKMEFSDCVNYVAALLKEEGKHSLTEGQAKYVYGRNRVFNPTKLKASGLCSANCHKCLRLRDLI